MAGKLRNKSAAASPRAATRRPPSARRARKAAVVRRRLIEAALSGFEKRGFARTTIDLITEGAHLLQLFRDEGSAAGRLGPPDSRRSDPRR